METLTKLYRIGIGPSSSHTMGPRKAAEIFIERNAHAYSFKIELYSSLAATGKGHLTDKAISSVFANHSHSIEWIPAKSLPIHPNGLHFLAFDEQGNQLDSWEVYSIGGGALADDKEKFEHIAIYPLGTMQQILAHCNRNGMEFWEYVDACEDAAVWEHLEQVLDAMFAAIERGLKSEGVLPGPLRLPRKAKSHYRKVQMAGPMLHRSGLLSSYALAVAEENASGGTIVTAPTCGSCGVLPSVLYYCSHTLDCSRRDLIRALATAGLVGNLVKRNASISGAEVGCQGEIGTACAMASAAAVQLMGGTLRQIEYAAEMGLEHHLGLTCDPVMGLVQIPCIERNAFAAKRALSCAEYAWFSDGTHRISFDDVVEAMNQTGNDLPLLYRETSGGGLAVCYKDPQ